MCVLKKRQGYLRFGIAGMGVGALSVLSAISQSQYSSLVAGADINGEVRRRFNEAFPRCRVYDSVDALCADESLDAIWISTPSRLHADHAVLAASRKKHVIISKPMATTLAEAERMVEACERNGVKLIAGHSLGFSPAIIEMATLARSESGIGKVRVAQLVAFTDWMLLPRTPEEVDERLGGGIIHRQSPHQIDALRILCGGRAESVRGYAGTWMKERKAPGFFSAFIQFDNGALGTASHNGYGYLVGSEIVPWGADVGIGGSDIQQRALTRRSLREGTTDEEALKDSMRLGGSSPLFARQTTKKPWLPLHLGLTIVSCDRGDIRHSPHGIYVYSDDGRRELSVGDDTSWFGRSEIEELYQAVVNGRELYRDGAWGMATLEVALAIQKSSTSRTEIKLRHQTSVRPNAFSATQNPRQDDGTCRACMEREDNDA